MIVKPEGGSQGRGIFITKRLDDINVKEHQVVQRYMRHPFIIDGYKFDLRIYVVVTSCEPLRIFIFNEGLARFATEEYDPSYLYYDNLYIHLTNYAINKNNDNFYAEDEADGDAAGFKRTLDSIF